MIINEEHIDRRFVKINNDEDTRLDSFARLEHFFSFLYLFVMRASLTWNWCMKTAAVEVLVSAFNIYLGWLYRITQIPNSNICNYTHTRAQTHILANQHTHTDMLMFLWTHLFREKCSDKEHDNFIHLIYVKLKTFSFLIHV